MVIKRLFSLIFLLLFSAISMIFGLEMNDGKLSLKGEKSWSISYTSTDLGTLFSSFPMGFTLEQALKIDLKGYITDNIDIDAHFDDQIPASQHLTIGFTKDSFNALFGDFTADVGKENPFISYKRRVKGLGMSWKDKTSSADFFASIEEGEPHSKIFYGTTCHAAVKFTSKDETGEEMPYETNIKGLYHMTLSSTYIAGITDVEFQFTTSYAFEEFLRNYKLDVLFDFHSPSGTPANGDAPSISNKPIVSLPLSSYSVLDGELILNHTPSFILRNIIKTLIQEYNEYWGLEGGNEVKYLDETMDSDFLNEILSRYSHIVVSGTKYPAEPSAYKRGNFYYLGRSNVLRGSVNATLTINGKRYSSDALTELDMKVYYDEGYIYFSSQLYNLFGESLDDDAIQVSFKYPRSSSMFSLGFNVISKSEHVYLNSKLLKRDIDYTIDYETGTLLILVPLLETDVIKVDYETFRRGLGAQNYYNRLVAGGSISKQLVLGAFQLEGSVSGIYSSDLALSEDPTVPIMPNTHSVIGLNGKLCWKGLKIGYAWALSYDLFPDGKNAKPYALNSITGITSAKGLLFFATGNGLAIYNDVASTSTRWQIIEAKDGLPSSTINTVAATNDFVLVGTNNGLAFISLSDFTPDSTDWYTFFKRDIYGNTNWKVIHRSNGLPNEMVESISFFGDKIYLGTGNGIAVISLANLTNGKDIREKYLYNEITPFIVKDLVVKDEDTIYLIHNRTMYIYKIGENAISKLDCAAPVNIVKSLKDGIFAGTTKGLVRITDDATALIYPGVNILDVVDYDATRVLVTDEAVIYYGKKYLAGKEIDMAYSTGKDLWFGTKGGDVYYSLEGEEFSNSTTGIPKENVYRYKELEPHAANIDVGQAFKGTLSFPIGGWSVNGNVYYADDSYHAVQNRVEKGRLDYSASARGVLWDLGKLEILSSYSTKASSDVERWRMEFALSPNSTAFYIPDTLTYGFEKEGTVTTHRIKSIFRDGSLVDASFNTKDKTISTNAILKHSAFFDPFDLSIKFDKAFTYDMASATITKNKDIVALSLDTKTDVLNIDYDYSLNYDEIKEKPSYETHSLRMSSTFFPKSRFEIRGELDKKKSWNVRLNGSITSSLLNIPFLREWNLNGSYNFSTLSSFAPRFALNLKTNSIERSFGAKTTFSSTYGLDTYIYEGKMTNMNITYGLNLGLSKKFMDLTTDFNGMFKYSERHSSSESSTSIHLYLKPCISFPIFHTGKMDICYNLDYTDEDKNGISESWLKDNLSMSVKYRWGENWILEMSGSRTSSQDLIHLSNPVTEMYRFYLKTCFVF